MFMYVGYAVLKVWLVQFAQVTNIMLCFINAQCAPTQSLSSNWLAQWDNVWKSRGCIVVGSGILDHIPDLKPKQTTAD